MKNEVIFHCAKPITDINGNFIRLNKRIRKHKPTHTLVFKKYSDDTIIMGWAAAHPNDNYNKKIGRELAFKNVNTVANRLVNFSNRKISNINELRNELPSIIIKNEFDYYLDCAINLMYDLSNVENLNLIFRGTNSSIYKINVEFEDISLEELKIRAEETNMKSEIIFATYIENDKLFVSVQNRKDFYDNGFNDEFNLEQIKDINTDDFTESDLIKYMSEKGYCYDPNITLEFMEL